MGGKVQIPQRGIKVGRKLEREVAGQLGDKAQTETGAAPSLWTYLCSVPYITPGERASLLRRGSSTPFQDSAGVFTRPSLSSTDLKL